MCCTGHVSVHAAMHGNMCEAGRLRCKNMTATAWPRHTHLRKRPGSRAHLKHLGKLHLSCATLQARLTIPAHPHAASRAQLSATLQEGTMQPSASIPIQSSQPQAVLGPMPAPSCTQYIPQATRLANMLKEMKKPRDTCQSRTGCMCPCKRPSTSLRPHSGLLICCDVCVLVQHRLQISHSPSAHLLKSL
jgi:hypothetical protein